MYSELNPSTFKLVQLWGRTNENPPREIAISAAWMRGSLMRIVRRPDAPVRLRQAVMQYAHAYGWDVHAWDESLPAGLEFVAYTVYEHEWALRADGDPNRPPDTVKRLFELQREDAPAAPAGSATDNATTTTASGEALLDSSR